MISILVSITGILLTIFFIVGIHEFGHFLVARLAGIKVLRFSLGFGKALFRWHSKKGTEFVLAAIPLGGYVKMLDENEEPVAANELHLAFNHQPLYKKLAVVSAGPLANFIFAFVLYWLIFVIGFTTLIPVIGQITPHSLADNAGLKPQDEILSIDHKPTRDWNAVLIRLITYLGDRNQIEMKTQSFHSHLIHEHTLDLTHWKINDLKPDPLASLGIEPYQPKILVPELLRKNQYSFFAAMTPAKQEVIDLTVLNFQLLGKMLTGKISLQGLGGPITIFESAGTALNHGILPFISFLAFFSIAIGVLNTVPIPGLDGGHVLIYCIECITRRPLSTRVQALIFRVGIIALLLLMTQALVNDMMRLL